MARIAKQKSIYRQKVEIPATDVLTKPQVAKLLQVAERTITAWMRAGLPHRRCRRSVRFSRSAVEAWVAGPAAIAAAPTAACLPADPAVA